MEDIKDPISGDISAEQPQEDSIKNLKAEMTRKIENTSSELEKLRKSNEELTSLMRSMMAPPEKDVTKEVISKGWFENDPSKTVELLDRRTDEIVQKKLLAMEAAKEKQSRTINELVSQYPELNDASSELYKKAIEVYSTMGGDTSPTSYKAAVYQAALELDVKPVSKRKKASSDDFSFGGSTGGGRVQGPTADEVKAQLEFASLLGISDPKALERIKNSTKKGR